MADSFAGLTIGPLRAGGGWKIQPSRRLAQYVEHVPGSNKNVISKGGLEVEQWTGPCDMTEAVYSSLKSTYLSSETASTVILDGVTRSGWLMDISSPAVVGTTYRANLTIMFDS